MIFDLSDQPASEADDVVIPELSDGILRELFAAAGKVLRKEPWKQLYDSDWFGIRDPDSGETHIVAIMGAGREVFALQVYLPEEGIRFWNQCILTGIPDMNLGKHYMRMLSCEFVPWNEEEMAEIDIERNETYGDGNLVVDYLDTFLFSSTLPGCINWHPEEAEAVKILDALRLLPVFLKDYKKLSPQCYEVKAGETYPEIPVYELKKNGDRAKPADWKLTYETFPEAGPEPGFIPDELFPARLAGFPVRKNETWEIGSVYMEQPVVCDGRPSWMTVTLTATQGSGMLLGTELLPVSQPKETALRKSFLTAVERAGFLPGEMHVRSEVALEVFQKIPELTVRMKDRLPLFDEIAEHFLRDFEGMGDDHPLSELSPESSEKIQELLSRFPLPQDASAAEMMAMMAELRKIEGAELILEHLMEMENGKPPALELVGQEPAPSTHRYLFRIALEGTQPLVWRQLSIGADSTFTISTTPSKVSSIGTTITCTAFRSGKAGGSSPASGRTILTNSMRTRFSYRKFSNARVRKSTTSTTSGTTGPI